jgi:transposase-like protein
MNNVMMRTPEMRHRKVDNTDFLFKGGFMKKTKDGRRLFTRAFKIAAIKRVQRGEKQAAVARDLGIGVELLARWRQRVRDGGRAALSEIGRAIGRVEGNEGKDAVRIAELEWLVGFPRIPRGVV